MRTICVVSVARSDYGIYLPILNCIRNAPDLRLSLLVAGMHLSPAYGMTRQRIEADGFEIEECIDMLVDSSSPAGVAKTIGLGLIGFAQAYSRAQPDILVVLGDRFEMYSAALAALPFKIPVAHIHGGEITEGAIDDALRHSMTKLSHLHFAATEEYAARIVQLGEEPWRVTVSGAPGLDNLKSVQLRSRQDLETRYDIDLGSSFLLVTFHPVTLGFERVEDQVGELLAALGDSGYPVFFTRPNADPGSHVISERIAAFLESRPGSRLIDNLGTQDYFSLMALATAMVGNSSSGIIEAPSFGLPVVNIGSRQAGRVRGLNVIDVPCERSRILQGILQAADPDFKKNISGTPNPYWRGDAAQIIVERLRTVPLDERLLVKRFFDLDDGRPNPRAKP